MKTEKKIRKTCGRTEGNHRIKSLSFWLRSPVTVPVLPKALQGMTEKSVTSAWSRGWSHRYLPGNVWEISEFLHMRHV